MMSPETVPATKDDGGSRKPTQARPPEQSQRCPRCDSPNTKFCYYNNYSLTQPRHFCKTCRRYWTKGGALRNVPIGGGCRKNKKGKSSSSSSSSSRLSADSGGMESSDIGGLKFFQGLSPAMDFQFGGLTGGSFPRYSPFGDISIPQSAASTSLPLLGMENLGISNPLMGINFPIPSLMKQTGEIQHMGGDCGGGGGGGSMNVNSSLANSIESLSCMNQDLHWKLQQQRLAMIFGGGGSGGGDDETENQKQQQQQMEKPQPIMFQNLEIAKAADVACPVKDGGNIATEWYFDSSYAPMNPTPTNSSGNNGNESTSNWSTGMQNWSDMNQYI